MNPLYGELALGTLSTLAAAVAIADPGTAAPAERGDVRVSWNGKRFTPEALPADVGAASRAAVDFWKPWAAEHGYQMALCDDGRVLLLVPERERPADLLKLVAKTCASVDAAATPSAPRPAVSERPAGPPVSADPGVEPEGATWTWDDGEPALDSETAVLLELAGAEEYHAALEQLAEHHAYLRPWIGSARGQNGFVLEQPLCAAWLRAGPGSEEWDPANELVNRCAQLCFLRRFGSQPYWLRMGLAWHVEDEVRGTLYCFPHRDGFVGVTEHTGWDKEFRRLVEKRGGLALDALAGWLRGTFDAERALCAFGAATFLARSRAERLPAILTELRATTRREGRVHHADGTWELIPDYELPAERQAAILAKHLGPRWLEEL